MAVAVGKTFQFEEFRLEPDKRLLSRDDGAQVRLAHRPFQVLLYLIENRDRIVTRDELLERFWDGREVYDEALTKCVGAIRKALNDPLDHPRFIETRWAEGYRFIGPIEEHPSDEPSFVAIEKSREVKIVVEESDEDDAVKTEKIMAAQSLKPLPFIKPRRLSGKTTAMAACLGLALAIGASVFLRSRSSQNQSAQSAPPAHSIAVLPFKNLSNHAERESFTDGLTESLISSLSKIEGLKVISRNSVFTFKGQDPDPREVGRRLGVATVLEGSVRESGERLRVEVRLVNTADGQILWSGDNFDRALGDVFEIQDDIARSVTTRLQLKLSSADERRLTQRQTNNVAAYQAYLKGLHYRNQLELPKAVEFYKEALRIEPNYALAHEGLAVVYALMEMNSQVPPGEAAPLAEFHAHRALAADENLAGAYLALGVVKTLKNYDLNERVRYYREAIRRHPNYLPARRWLSSALLAQGKFAEVEAELLRVQEADPLSYGVRLNLAELYFYWRKPDKAIEQANLMLVANPESAEAHALLGKAYWQKGLLTEAAAEFEKYDPSGPQISILMATGRNEEARKAAEKLAASERAKISPYAVGCTFAAIGDKEKALAWLEKAYELRQADLVSIKIEPGLDDLRSDPRFADLLRRVGLEP